MSHDMDDHRLLHAIGREAAGHLDPDDARNAPYFAWLGREARARQTAREEAETRARAAAWARRCGVRDIARRLHVRLAAGRAPLMPLPEAVPLGASLERSRHGGPVPALDVRAAAGVGREIRDEPCAEVLLRPTGLGHGDYLALRVAGDSMTPLLHDGDTILLKLGAAPAPNSVVVARLPDDGYVVKKVARADGGLLELESLNRAYAPIVVRGDEVQVLGTVVMRWRGGM